MQHCPAVQQHWLTRACTLPQVGAELVLAINTTRTTARELSRMNVQIAYLRSYTNMGMALVR